MAAQRQRARNAAARAIAAGQLQLPLDIDQLATAVGATVDIEPELPHIPAYREGNVIVMRAGLSRSRERMLGSHEVGHVALDSLSVEEPLAPQHCQHHDEEEVNQFRDHVLVPPLDLFERIENGETEEEICLAYGLEREDLHKIYQAHLKEMKRRMM